MAVVLGAIVSVRVLTELLDPVSYGELALGLTIATLLNQLLFGPLNQGAMRFYAPAREAGEISAYGRSLSRLVVVATTASLAMACALISGLLLVDAGNWVGLAVAALVFSILSGNNSILNGVQNAARQRAIVALHQGVASWLRLIAAALFIVWFGASSTNALYGYALAMLLVLISQWCFLRQVIPAQADRIEARSGWERRILGYSWPFGAWGIFYWAQSASDRWALQYFSSTTDVGLFAVLYQLGFYPISLATGIAVQFIAPVLFQRAGDGSNESRAASAVQLGWWLTFLALGLTGVAFVIAYLAHDLIFELLVAEEYRSISNLLPWMIVAGGLFAAGQTVALNLMSQMRTLSLLPIKVGTAVIGVVLNVLAAHLYGVAGVVYAGIAAAAIFLFWAMYIGGRTHMIPKEIPRP